MSKGGNEKTHATQRRLLATLGSMGVAGKPRCGSGNNTPTARSGSTPTPGSNDGVGSATPIPTSGGAETVEIIKPSDVANTR
ncbi:hypothetical protein [Halocatena marina]|uniref:hypothetical protein n=1 Tax=Halocatena marina TaxID=2934937 RepID=UPI00200E09AC|nr:hypothetical protein [Halocatena marina]